MVSQIVLNYFGSCVSSMKTYFNINITYQSFPVFIYNFNFGINLKHGYKTILETNYNYK